MPYSGLESYIPAKKYVKHYVWAKISSTSMRIKYFAINAFNIEELHQSL